MNNSIMKPLERYGRFAWEIDEDATGVCALVSNMS